MIRQMQSRRTTDVRPGKSKPTAFKALCLPNTDFMVDFLGCFTRNDFEKSLQLTCKRMNQLILTHFHSKPYRLLDDVTLNCNVDRGMRLGLTKPRSKKLMPNGYTSHSWDPANRRWLNGVHIGWECSEMQLFLDKTVCVIKVLIKFTYGNRMLLEPTYGLPSPGQLTQGNISDLQSLSHIWENTTVEVSMDSYLKQNLASSAKQLRSAKLFSCRRFICAYGGSVLYRTMIPLSDYPEIYSLEVVEVKAELNMNRIVNDLTPIIRLVENQALYPNSQTTFVFSEYIHTSLPPFATKDFIKHIRNEFVKSDKAQSFQIIFHFKFAGVVLSEGEKDEFCLQNNRTHEVLQFRFVTHNEVAKFCEFDAKAKYFILKRSQI